MGDSAPSYASWVGKTAKSFDNVTAFPLSALAATLDRDSPRDALPPGWHWLYFLPVAKQGQIGSDGHPERGGFLPPIPLPRRMWAAGRMTFHSPMVRGANLTRTSTIVSVNEKSGRSGNLVFVTVRHDVSADGKLAVSEEQDIVYRDKPTAGASVPAPTAAPEGEEFSRQVTADPVMLFRYSALTFNGHRIHYDRPYATAEEGYPGLVVQGPLIATLLLDLFARQFQDIQLKTFSFRAVRPTFADVPFLVCGKQGKEDGQLDLWSRDMEGSLTMLASATVY